MPSSRWIGDVDSRPTFTTVRIAGLELTADYQMKAQEERERAREERELLRQERRAEQELALWLSRLAGRSL